MGVRADHPNHTVPALPVVAHLNVLERLPVAWHLGSRISDLETLAMSRLDLQALEKILGARVVVTIPLHILSENSESFS